MTEHGGNAPSGGGERRDDADAGDLVAGFGLLGDYRRLHALLCLRESESPMTLGALADEIAARELETAPEFAPEGVRERIRTSLYHVHLPKLRAAGVVRWDEGSDRVSLAPGAKTVEAVLEAVFDD